MVFDSRNDRVNGLAVVDVEPLASRDLEPARVEAELLEDRGVDVRHVVPGEKPCSANLADTERNERQAFKRQQFSAAKSEMAYHNHFVLNSLGGNPKSAMPVFPFAFASRR
jgi:hypothetical protein